MDERERSPSYAVASQLARRVLAIIEREAAARGWPVQVTAPVFRRYGLHVVPATTAVRELVALGLIEKLKTTKHEGNTFAPSDRWRTLSASAAIAAALAAREPVQRLPKVEPRPIDPQLRDIVLVV